MHLERESEKRRGKKQKTVGFHIAKNVRKQAILFFLYFMTNPYHLIWKLLPVGRPHQREITSVTTPPDSETVTYGHTGQGTASHWHWTGRKELRHGGYANDSEAGLG